MEHGAWGDEGDEEAKEEFLTPNSAPPVWPMPHAPSPIPN
ncbi:MULTISPECIES: histidine kinase [Nostoc]|uniref:Histidine kinase n=1 Tax=Nostoc paludosum FACHB-159 TaxID=2692908 RepID=A0ABR8KJU4_9NOSO|nr:MULTISPECIES: histidine kinase [Nostoc]MBD2683004.1 histidine kinase [Nostoc sp. FACHB-857]MBD2739345.1 histidine kinase [Nostoc paludosum FACHB-159]